MLSGEAANTNFLVFGLIRLHREPNIYPTRGKHANYYTNDAVETDYILKECCLRCEQFCIYIMAWTNYLMRWWWWCRHCTGPTPRVGFKNNQQKNMFLRHTILTQSQPVFALNPKCDVEKQPLLILWFDPIVDQIQNLLPSEWAREPLL